MRRILKRMLTLSLVLLCMCTVVFESGIFDLEASAATTYYQTAVEDVVLRAGPSSDYDIKKTIAAKGTVVKVVGSTTNSSGNLWYQLSDGNWVFSERVTKHTHSYTGGICTNTTCKYEWAYTVTSVSRTGVVTNTSGCAYYNRPYSKSSTKYGTYAYNKVLSVTGVTVNQEGNTWYKTSDGYWVYSGNVTERFTVKYNMNGGTGSIASQTFLSGKTLKLSTVKPTRVGYNFKGWATSSTATTAAYASGGSYSAKKSVTLYAVWAKCSHTYESGYCTKCKYEYPLTITSTSKTVVVTNADGCTYYNRPYSGSSVAYGVYAKNTVLTVTASTKNQPGNLWYRTNNNYWIYSGNVTERFYIKYNANGGTGAPSTHYALAGTKVTFSTAEPKRVGYVFMGWAVEPTEYSSNLSYIVGTSSINKNYTLYAVWKKCTSHTYTGGICTKCKYEYPLTITNLSRRYYVVTNEDGCAYYNRPYSKSSTRYGAFAYKKVLGVVATTTNQEGNVWYKTTDGYWVYSGNLTRRYTVKYNANGGENAPSTQYLLSGKTLTLSKTKPTRVGYIFKGWATSSSSTTVAYKAGASYSKKSDVTLYAVWSKCTSHSYTGGICTKCSYEYPLTTTTYKATFVVTNKNGAKIWSRPYSNNSTHVTTLAYGKALYATVKTVNEEGNTWYQLSDGNWVYSGNIARGYWLIYDANGGTGAPSAVAKTKGTQVTLSSAKPTRSGYTFLGWSTTASGSVKYKAGSKYTINGSATLYAVWAKNAAITSNPATRYVKSGDSTTMSVSATGTGLTYQWQYRTSSSGSWTNCSGCTTKSVKITAGSNWNGYQYRCVVKDTYGNKAYSKAATLYVLCITSQPKTAYAQSGAKVSTTVKATGGGLTYTWYVKNANGTSYSKSANTTATYSVTMTSTSKDRYVYCIVTDKAGNSVRSNTVRLRMAATVTTQPKTAYAKSGAIVKTTVTAVGDGLTYQWYVKNVGGTSYSKSSNTTATYSCKMSSTSKDRYVYCVIKDKYGNSVQSNTVRLRMAATITTQPKSVTVAEGEQAKVTLKAAGDGLTYTWYYKDAGSSKFYKTTSFTGTSYYVTMNDARDGRQIYCVVTDKYGKTATTNTVTLNMK